MKTLCWNTRGLGNPRSVRVLYDIIRHEDPNMVFPIETKLVTRKLKRIRLRLCLHGCIGADCEGRRGGLSLMWKEDVELSLINFSKYHINVTIKNSEERKW